MLPIYTEGENTRKGVLNPQENISKIYLGIYTSILPPPNFYTIINSLNDHNFLNDIFPKMGDLLHFPYWYILPFLFFPPEIVDNLDGMENFTGVFDILARCLLLRSVGV